MKTFKVFSHPTLGFQAVKVGFSWPGCLFSFIWAFVKKLWGHGFGILGINIIAALIEKTFEREKSDAGTLLMILIQLGVYIFVGMKGNEWRESNLRRRGFEFIDTVHTDTPDAAIGKIARKNKMGQKEEAAEPFEDVGSGSIPEQQITCEQCGNPDLEYDGFEYTCKHCGWQTVS